MQTLPRAPNLRLAVGVMMGGSLFVPLAGVLTAPLLARALSPEGRGEVAAAMAPAVLMLAVATLGLPEALTYHVAKRPHITRVALASAAAISVVLGLGCVALVWLSAPFLSNGDMGLAEHMLLAASVTVPALLVNALRGVASGHQFWMRVAIEKLVVSSWRLLWFIGLFATGHLTVLSAILVTVTAPFVGGVVYLPLLWTRFVSDEVDSSGTVADHATDGGRHAEDRVLQPLVSFGLRIWFGAVSMMLLARTSDLFMVPLASATDLGLYAVAITIADVPLLVAFAIQSAVFGVSSRSRDAAQVTATSRLTLLVGFIGCSGMAVVLPFAIGPLFGSEYSGALIPSLLIMLRTLYGLPGLLAGSALAAWGRPGLRSFGLVAALVTNLTGFFLLVPVLGLYGAVVAGFVTGTVTNVVMILSARRVLGVRGRDFWLINRADVSMLWRELNRLRVKVATRVTLRWR